MTSTVSKDHKGLAAPQVAPTYIQIVGRDELFGVRRIYCVGRNYLEHIREMQEGDERDPPFFFQKPTDAIVTNGQVPMPPATSDFQYEAELVIAIGAEGSHVSMEHALDLVLGYAVGLDMTRRDHQRTSCQRGHPWEIGKSFDHSAPCAPIHPVETVGHLLEGPLSLEVNGTLKQQSRLEKMIWNVPEIICQLSQLYRLMPGDLIFTGTPEGVGAVHPGDTLIGRIAALTPLEVTITAA